MSPCSIGFFYHIMTVLDYFLAYLLWLYICIYIYVYIYIYYIILYYIILYYIILYYIILYYIILYYIILYYIILYYIIYIYICVCVFPTNGLLYIPKKVFTKISRCLVFIKRTTSLTQGVLGHTGPLHPVDGCHVLLEVFIHVVASPAAGRQPWQPI